MSRGKKHLQALVDEFNSTVPVGTWVDYVDDFGYATPFKTKAPAEVLGGHTAVIWLEEKRGCVALSRIERKEVA